MSQWDPTYMVLPSMSCQASCTYCFGPHKGPMMDELTAEKTVEFIARTSRECSMDSIRVVFHGGEPLLAPVEIWKILLEGLDSLRKETKVRLSVQSNLWALNDELLELFRRYEVHLGTSLDGPKEICDINRGEGYYERTYASIEKARQHRRDTGVICTLTGESLPHLKEIMEFFRDRALTPVLHCAVKALGKDNDPSSLTPDEFADAVILIYEWYINNRKYIRIPTLDHYVAALIHGEAGVCTMSECLGLFCVIGPTGDITSCQRFAGMEGYRLGNIFDDPSLEELFSSPAALKQRERQIKAAQECSECRYLNICHGGCWYNAVSSGDGITDPLCGAYMKIYSFLEEKLSEEAVSEENLMALRSHPFRIREHPLLKSGKYISLADSVHPSMIAENARNVLAYREMARTGDPAECAEKLVRDGITSDTERTRSALETITEEINRQRSNLNNCYLHVTARCNLRCTHCYAEAGETGDEMDIADISKLSEEALGLHFRQIVMTGGEPLRHGRRKELLSLCRSLRHRGSNIVLRTNLTGVFTDDELKDIASSFDQVAVSVDGNRQTHDLRRGDGTYDNVTANIERYMYLSFEMTDAAEMSLACVMDSQSINSDPGNSVRELARRLGIPRIRFKSLLPLGRAASMEGEVICEGMNDYEEPLEMLRMPFRPLVSCGIGENIYIRPDGGSYPCYAWQTEHSYLGNVCEEGLCTVLGKDVFTRLRRCTVDTIEKCRECEYRYICGGACRAWGNRDETDPNAAPPECEHLKRRASSLLDAAMGYLNET